MADGETANKLTELPTELTMLCNKTGVKVTAPNGNTLFMPLTGGFWVDGIRDGNCIGWLSTQYPLNNYTAHHLWFSESLATGDEGRCVGLPVRPIQR